MLKNARLQRKPNTSSSGKAFDKITLAQVWLRADAVPGQDPNRIRADACGAWMAFAEFGRASPLGWEIDHIRPIERGGDDELNNLQALHWANNRRKAAHWPCWDGAVQAWNRVVDKDLLLLRTLRSAVRTGSEQRNRIGDDHGIV